MSLPHAVAREYFRRRAAAPRGVGGPIILLVASPFFTGDSGPYLGRIAPPL